MISKRIEEQYRRASNGEIKFLFTQREIEVYKMGLHDAYALLTVEAIEK